ncbi:MAG: S41 family peptidase [Ignavibacteriaceae bacterium]|jgi:hypothetical protein|nr:S41 family peptidase [Ignavibacteriaceae bacterium]
MKKLFLLLLVLLLIPGCEEMLLGPNEDNPRTNFEALWNTLDKSYALFPVKKVNWDELHSFYGDKITSLTSQDELWNICSDLIRTLDDGHVVLFNKRITNATFSTSVFNRPLGDFNLDFIKSKYLDNVQSAGDGMITYGKIKPGFSNIKIGYINIVALAASSKRQRWPFDLAQVLNDLSDSDAMIIDLRNVGGGLKTNVPIFSSFFVDREFTYFYQQEKIGPGHFDFGERFPLSVSPNPAGPTFTKKIALLTNRFSASAAEHTSQIFKYLPYATQIGDTTEGAFGDVVTRGELPNGWTFLYPIRLTKTPEGFCPEGVGIAPDIYQPNTKQDIDLGIDKIMIRAIEHLSK